jgi:hypothetical protein
MKDIRLRTTATLLGLFCATVAYPQQPQTTAAVPKLVRFSGSFRPAAGQPSQSPAPSTESVTLSVYRDQTGGTALWQEIQNVAVDADGSYSLLMGATQNEGMPLDLFSSGEPRWLGARFNRPGEVEQPRVLLVSVPYALKASDAETLGGRPASAYLLAHAPEESTTAGIAGIAGVTGVTGITATTPSTNKAVKPKGTPANSGQPNYIGKFTNTTDLIDSSMYEVGGNVGISTAAPLISLDVRTGSLPQMGIAGTTDYLTFFASDVFGPAIYWDPGKDMRFGKGGASLYNPFGFTEQMRIQSSTGNVGIGTMTPGSKLEVDSAATGVPAIQGIATATSGVTAGVGGASNSPNGTGVGGINNAATGGNGGNFISKATSGNSVGVAGSANSPNGAGVNGFNNSVSGGYPVGVMGGVAGSTGAGVQGNASMAGASGVSGYNSATSGYAVGVNGGTASNSGAGVGGGASMAGAYGVSGYNGATSGYAVGVQGNSNSTSGAGVRGGVNNAGAVGVQGNNNATSGYAIGVNGFTASNNGAGVAGSANFAGAVGVNGFNNATSGFAVGVSGGTASNNGAGVQGNASLAGASGVNGFNSATSGYAVGVSGGTASTNGAGVSGNSNVAGVFGVVGFNSAASGYAIGTEGATSSPGGAGVWAVSMTCGNSNCTLVPGTAGQFQAANTGVLLQGLSGAAGANIGTSTQVFLVDGHGNGSYSGNVQVNGNLNVGGTLSKSSGSFRIDHPLDPENKYLYHSFVESPDMKNMYDGVLTLGEKGEAVVTLPDWFEALNQDFRYQLTCVGGYAPVYVASEVSGNQFRVAGGRPGLKVSWQVTGTRHDSYANSHRIQVEVEKQPNEKGIVTDAVTPVTPSGAGRHQ